MLTTSIIAYMILHAEDTVTVTEMFFNLFLTDAIHTASRMYRQKHSGHHMAAVHVMISHNCLCMIYGATSP